MDQACASSGSGDQQGNAQQPPPQPDAPAAAAAAESHADEQEVSFCYPMAEAKHRDAFVRAFEQCEALAAVRTKMRSDLVAALKHDAPLDKRAKAASLFGRLTGSAPAAAAHSSSLVLPSGVPAFDSLGEELPKYIAATMRQSWPAFQKLGVKLAMTEMQNILVDWMLEPFYSKFVRTKEKKHTRSAKKKNR